MKGDFQREGEGMGGKWEVCKSSKREAFVDIPFLKFFLNYFFFSEGNAFLWLSSEEESGGGREREGERGKGGEREGRGKEEKWKAKNDTGSKMEEEKGVRIGRGKEGGGER